MTPIFRIAFSLCSVSVPGSHSKVISSASFHGVTCGQALDQPLELRASTGTTACRRRSRRSSAAARRSPAAARTAPIPCRGRRGSARSPARSCRCRRGSSRSGSASGRTGCAGRARAASPGPAAPAAPASRRARPPRPTRRKTADRWRRNSCRLRARRGPVGDLSAMYSFNYIKRSRLKAELQLRGPNEPRRPIQIRDSPRLRAGRSQLPEAVEPAVLRADDDAAAGDRPATR